jgi:hemerythrin superfamily protein
MAHITKDLWDQHRKIEALFQRLTHGTGAFYATIHQGAESGVLPYLINEIELHSAIEEEVLYPALAEIDERLANESQQDHDEVRDLIDAIQDTEPGDPALAKLVRRLEKKMMAHARREEQNIFPIVKQRLYHEGFEMGRQAFAVRQELLGARGSTKPPAQLGWPGAGWN